MQNSNDNPNVKNIGVILDLQLLSLLEESAKKNERKLSGQIRCILKEYYQQKGKLPKNDD